MELIKNIVQKLQDGLNQLPKDSFTHQNPFVYYESQITLQKFQDLCEKYKNHEGPITEEFVNELGKILENRGFNIARSPAAYDAKKTLDKVESSANIYCSGIVEMYILLANKFDYRRAITPKKILMPPEAQHVSFTQAYENLVKSVIKDLNENPKINASLSKSIDIDMKFVAKRMLNIINNVEKGKNKNPNEDDIFVTKESEQTIDKIKELLQYTQESDEPFSVNQLDPFIKLLADRGVAIFGPYGYLENHNAKVNKICRSLANYIALICCRSNYLNKEPDDFLIPIPSPATDQKTAYRHLQKFACEDIKNREDLIAEMYDLNCEKWKTYAGGFELEKLISVITNGQTMDSFFKAKDTYTEDELRSKIILFCIFEIYAKDRISFPYHKTRTSDFLSYFPYVTTVYNINDKLAAVKAMQDSIIIEVPKIIEKMNNPKSDLYKHKGALEDCEMKKFTDEVYKAIEKLPKKEEECVNEVDIPNEIVNEAPNRIGIKM